LNLDLFLQLVTFLDSLFLTISFEVELLIFTLWLSIFEVTELTVGFTIFDDKFSAISAHESVFELSLLDILDVLILRLMVTVALEIDNTTKSVHGRFDLIKIQLSDMESIFHGDLV